LDVTNVGCFYCCIWKTLSSTHRMKEKLMRLQPLKKRAEHKSSRLWRVIILSKVRKSPFRKSKGNSLPIHILIPQAKHNLCQIGLWPLGFSCNHFINIIFMWWYFFWDELLHDAETVVKFHVDDAFKGVQYFLTFLMKVFVG